MIFNKKSRTSKQTIEAFLVSGEAVAFIAFVAGAHVD
jgi:hypothetical protein